jgi:L-lysine exporter family protein LysE/ArgO
MWHIFSEGFFLQAILILALGAQNIFVLESGLKKQLNLLVAGLCSLCDLVLIAIGVLGAATIFVRVPILKSGFGIIGAIFLAYYGIRKILEAKRSTDFNVETDKSILSKKKIIFATLAFSLLNPHVYLDTIILIGGYSAKFSELATRLIFGLGAGIFSILWFFSLSIFAYYMSTLLNNSKAMRLISFLSGVILLALSAKLGIEVSRWL